jgi:hypothetical protein
MQKIVCIVLLSAVLMAVASGMLMVLLPSRDLPLLTTTPINGTFMINGLSRGLIVWIFVFPPLE